MKKLFWVGISIVGMAVVVVVVGMVASTPDIVEQYAQIGWGCVALGTGIALASIMFRGTSRDRGQEEGKKS